MSDTVRDTLLNLGQPRDIPLRSLVQDTSKAKNYAESIIIIYVTGILSSCVCLGKPKQKTTK